MIPKTSCKKSINRKHLAISMARPSLKTDTSGISTLIRQNTPDVTAFFREAPGPVARVAGARPEAGSIVPVYWCAPGPALDLPGRRISRHVTVQPPYYSENWQICNKFFNFVPYDDRSNPNTSVKSRKRSIKNPAYPGFGSDFRVGSPCIEAFYGQD